ncbi:hypothetical protein [Kineococcus sp. SYSU DK003]|uniref:hypothetical protein n=1 Tax=Kineococcus sp. SYSU DK003 TaxID=3383124 RepID=UPI003D7DC81C
MQDSRGDVGGVERDVRERLRHVRWLGGGSGAAKSTVARELNHRYGVSVYATDDVMAEHASRLSPRQAPLLHRFAAMTMDERWVTRAPREMLETFHWFAGEGFALVVEDLLESPSDRVVVAEGFRLLPHLVRPLLTGPGQALWLLPTPQFRHRALRARGGTMTIAGRTSDPDRALANLLERDALFTERLAEDLAGAADEAVVVDGSASLRELTDRVARRFGLSRGSTTRAGAEQRPG